MTIEQIYCLKRVKVQELEKLGVDKKKNENPGKEKFTVGRFLENKGPHFIEAKKYLASVLFS